MANLSAGDSFPVGEGIEILRGQSLVRGVSAVCARRVLRPLCRIAGLGNKIGLFGKTPVFWRFPEWALQAASGELQKEGEGKSVKNSFAMAFDLRVCSGVSHREV